MRSRVDVLFKATRRASILDPYKPYIEQRRSDGITNAATLHHELQARGWNRNGRAAHPTRVHRFCRNQGLTSTTAATA